MFKLYCVARRALIHWQIHRLERKADHIVAARQAALDRLKEIQRACVEKQVRLRGYAYHLGARDAW
ncbi:hypothetical protein [Massilia sp. Root335]|uniref:hypothetical protein n=1 Tax=Massilia sp. Root335 TaxID=1736517 RepID=UPI0006FD32FD|nr:hypothetical protein [Massilia sp. Root335]KQV52369.1 hypothetical protein ASC93_07135 [Massilia sp. Root335]